MLFSFKFSAAFNTSSSVVAVHVGGRMGVKTSCVVHTSFKNVNFLHKKWNLALFSKEIKSEFLDIDGHVWLVWVLANTFVHCTYKTYVTTLSIPTNKCIFSQIWMNFFVWTSGHYYIMLMGIFKHPY